MSAEKLNKRRKRRKVAPAEDKVPTSQQRRRLWLRFLLPAAVFCWPFLYLFRHVFPNNNGEYAAIGNDFILLYYKYKVYLLACLADSHFPLWSPAEGAGYPFYTNPFTQAFLRDAVRYQQSGHLVSYTGDELVREINAPVEGYLSFIDNWGRDWKVFIDGKVADIELLFGTLKSVRLASGHHRVRFSYQPGLF